MHFTSSGSATTGWGTSPLNTAGVLCAHTEIITENDFSALGSPHTCPEARGRTHPQSDQWGPLVVTALLGATLCW